VKVARVLVVAAVCLALVACSPQPRRAAKSTKARKPAATVVRRTPPPPVPAYRPYTPWGEHSIATRLADIGPKARQRWWPHFDAARTAYPPWYAVIAAFKRERRVEVYAGPSPYELALVRSIDMTAASGGPGPKLREGDRQVPEGVYAIQKLNPNSLYHVALRLDYPNDFDRMMASMDGRHRLGGDIMIHGSDRSIGCIAVGDQAAEDLFVLAADTGLDNVSVVIAPSDFRRDGGPPRMPGRPPWIGELYARIDRTLRTLPLPRPPAPPPSVGEVTADGRRTPR